MLFFCFDCDLTNDNNNNRLDNNNRLVVPAETRLERPIDDANLGRIYDFIKLGHERAGTRPVHLAAVVDRTRVIGFQFLLECLMKISFLKKETVTFFLPEIPSTLRCQSP